MYKSDWEVGEPTPITESSGSDDSSPPAFLGATLECEPFYTDWSTYGRVDVYDDAIMPGSTYQLDTILNADECKITEEYGFSAPVAISTVDVWGDVVGDCGVIPCSVPNGVVGFDDISAVVDKLRNLLAAPIKARTDLMNSNVSNPLPDRKIDFVDISFCVDAFRGFPSGNPYPGPDKIECDPYLGDCYADIRADIDGDGDIDSFDEVLQGSEVMGFFINGDDDDNTEVADSEEAPVIGEDDLAEIQLAAACDVLPEFAWWSLSWDDPEAPMVVWLEPDKSDGTGGPGIPLENGTEYDWPPPSTVWLEATDAIEDLELTFAVYDGTGEGKGLRAPLSGPSHVGDSSESFSASIPTDYERMRLGANCTWRGKYLRYWAMAQKAGDVTSASALIETHWPLAHCAVIGWGLGRLSSGLSSVWVAVVRQTAQTKMWAQMGYTHTKEPNKPNAKTGVYAEMVYGSPPEDNRFIFFDNQGTQPPPSGNHRYTVMHLAATFGTFNFLKDELPFWSFTHPNWQGLTGTRAEWAAELLHMEDQMVGTPENHCEVWDMELGENWGGMVSPGLIATDLKYDPTFPGPREWGLCYINDRCFHVYDKSP